MWKHDVIHKTTENVVFWSEPWLLLTRSEKFAKFDPQWLKEEKNTANRKHEAELGLLQLHCQLMSFLLVSLDLRAAFDTIFPSLLLTAPSDLSSASDSFY